MTDMGGQGAKAPLGVGEIISSSFSIFFGNLEKVMLLGFLGAFVGYIVNGLLLGFDVAMGVGEVDPTAGGSFFFGIIVSNIVNLVIYGIVTGLLILVAYDAKLGRSHSLSEYMQRAIPALLPIVVLSFVTGILTAVGLVALIVGGLWVYAVFYVTAPVAVIEQGGFGSMGRSAELTKEYRWPIVGLFVLVAILTVVITFVAGAVIGLVVAVLPSVFTVVVGGILFALITGFGYALGGIAVALTYARLREIKDGVDVDQIASVFD